MRERRPGSRRLAAILAADVAGYTRLTRADEEGTVGRLRALRRELIDPTLDAHGGRIIKTTGDGLLVEFGSVVDAVRCAVAVQRGMATRNTGLPENKRIVFRVGINVGDVLVEGDGDLMGDGLNVATRLEGIAEPGAIYLSGAAYEHVRDKLPLGFAELGERTVKNIDRPLQIYALGAAALASIPDNEATSESTSHRTRGVKWPWFAIAVVGILSGALWFGSEKAIFVKSASAPPLSIVVLPFTNLSGDSQHEYFADAITEDVTTDLSRIEGSFVIARNTAYTFKGKAVDVKEIAKELGVRYVLEGSVQRDRNTVRVNAQLIDGMQDVQLWADRFDGDLADLFELQNQITARIANSLRLAMLTAAGHQTQGQEANLDASEMVMRARALLAQPLDQASLHEIQGLCERAIALDGRLESAWDTLAVSLIYEVFNFRGADTREKLGQAISAAGRALALNPNDAEAHIVNGMVRLQQQRLAEASAELETAISLDRNRAFAYGILGLIAEYRGEPDKTIALDERAIRLSPRDPFLANWQSVIAISYLFEADDQQAIEWALKSRSTNPSLVWPPLVLAAAYAEVGDLTSSRRSAVEAQRLNPSLSIRELQSFFGSSEPGYLKLAQRMYDGLRKAGLPEQ